MFKQSEEDLAYEEEILRNPYSVKHWLRYCEFKKDAPPAVINLIYERALKEMPGRYQSAVIISYFFFIICVCVCLCILVTSFGTATFSSEGNKPKVVVLLIQCLRTPTTLMNEHLYSCTR